MFKGFSMKPSYASISWASIERTAAYVATSPGRRRASWDRDHMRGASAHDLSAIAEAKGFDPTPRLVRRAQS